MKTTAAVLISLAGTFFILPMKHSPDVETLKAVSARPTQGTPQEGKGCAAPKSWGELKGVADRAIAFEDSEGTIRVLDTGPCMRGQTQLIVKITRE